MSTSEIEQGIGGFRAFDRHEVPGARPTMGPLTTSAGIDQIAAALAKAQGAIQGAKKDTDNTFFKSRYADLASVWEACRAQLAANGIGVIQIPNGEGRRIPIKVFDKNDNPLPDIEGAEQRLTTLLVHSSGQWIGGTFVMVAGDVTPQAAGSCITYMRRYSLAALVGVAPEDDDGNSASGRSTSPQKSATAKPSAAPGPRPKGSATDAQLHDIREVAGELKWTRAKGEAFMKEKLGYAAELDALSTEDAKKLLEAMVAEQSRGAA